MSERKRGGSPPDNGPPPGKTYYDVGGELFVKAYARILIRRKAPTS